MPNFEEDVHHRTSLKVKEVIPDFVESDYPQFVAFMEAYYKFLEQYDSLPIQSTFATQNGIVTIQTGNSTVIGGNTVFTDASVDQRFKVGSDVFRIRSIANNSSLIVYDVPIRSYYANTYSLETNKTTRQASGTLRQILTFHDVENTIEDFIVYFRDTYLRDVPQGVSDTSVLISKVLEFYQSRGSEDAFRFLFRALYGKEITVKYPRDYVFRTSDAEWEVPTILKLDANLTFANLVSAPSSLLELRQIVGLTSNAIARVVRVQDAFDGPRAATVLYITDIISNRVSGDILLNSDIAGDDNREIIVTAFGTPPQGLGNIIYDFSLAQEDSTVGEFVPGEVVSTMPVDDPLAVRGTILGSVRAFTVEDGGAGYQLGDLVYPEPGWNGGYGAVGRVSGFANTDITEVAIVDGGEGYYAGISLTVDNSGTGGSGLAGYVQNVSPGNIVLHADPSANIAANDVLTFETYDFLGNVVSYQASREKIDYYEVGISMSELFGALLVNDSGPDDGSHLMAPISGTDYSLTQEAVVIIGSADWGGGNVSSAFYAANLSSAIVGVIGNLSVLPIYINGIRTEVGEVFSVNVTSFGSGYLQALPTISVLPVYAPTDANGTPLPVGIVPFESALLVANVALGQIGSVELVSGGAGYSATNAFSVNSSTSSSMSGNGASLGMVLGAIFTGPGRWTDSRSQASADRYIQDITYYQPFSYVLKVEKDISQYGDAVRRLVHPAGGLLITEQTVSSELDMGLEASETEVILL